ncbi:MAG: hypothetical protein NC397_08450 [Clostridium sp.]|nr:hypothetical protein [Clostridium sp.]
MATTKINCSGVINSSGRCDSAKQNINSAYNKVINTSNSLDSKIKQRASIASRLSRVSSNLSDIASRISNIQRVCNSSANTYQNVDRSLVQNAGSINNSKLASFK